MQCRSPTDCSRAPKENCSVDIPRRKAAGVSVSKAVEVVGRSPQPRRAESTHIAANGRRGLNGASCAWPEPEVGPRAWRYTIPIRAAEWSGIEVLSPLQPKCRERRGRPDRSKQRTSWPAASNIVENRTSCAKANGFSLPTRLVPPITSAPPYMVCVFRAKHWTSAGQYPLPVARAGMPRIGHSGCVPRTGEVVLDLQQVGSTKPTKAAV